MTTDRTRQLAVGLAVVQVLDAVANEIPRAYVKSHLDHLGVPAYLRPVLTPIKMSTAAGLLLGLDRPRLGALVSASLVAYYSAAARFHLLAGDNPLLAAPAAVCGAAAAVTLVERFLPAASQP